MSVLCSLGFHRYKTNSIYWKEVKIGSPRKAYKQKECVRCGLYIDEYQKSKEKLFNDLLKEVCKSMHPKLHFIK